MTVEEAAKLLTKAGGVRVSEAQIHKDIEANAPTNANGTINLVHYAAWLVNEMAAGVGLNRGQPAVNDDRS